MLVEEYIESLPFRLDFQDVGRELAEINSEYGASGRGAAFIAYDDEGAAVGCVGIRAFDDETAELKRMFVRPGARGSGLGSALCAAAVAAAAELGYSRIRLDTVAEMEAAISVYEKAGFRPIAPYRENPFPSARYFELEL